MSPQHSRPHHAQHALTPVVAALVVASMLLPQAVAYAAIAGVPTAHAVVAALVGLGVYALWGSSRYAIVSATSSAAAIFASVVAANGLAGGYALVCLTGILFVLAAIFRADFLATLIARPVLRGFAYALALNIVVRQLPAVAGLSVQASNFPQLLWRLLKALPQTHGPSLLLGMGTWALWLLLRVLRRRHAWVHPPLLIFGAGVLTAVALPLQHMGVASIGSIGLAPWRWQWPSMDWADWALAAHMAPALFMVLFAESWGTVRSISLQRAESASVRREMLALGLANVMSGIFQGLPVGAGYSASTANESAGGNTKLVGALAAVLMALMLLLVRDWLEMLPLPVMAAIAAGILASHLSPRRLLDTLKLKNDSWLALVTVAGVLLTGVMMGMLLSVGLSVLLVLWRFAHPGLSELGRLPGTREFLDRAHHPEVHKQPGVLILRPEEPVFFANAEAIFQQVRHRAVEQDLRAVVLSMEHCDDLDTTSVEALCELQQWMRKRGVQLLLARAKDRPRAALQCAAHPPYNERWQFFWSVDAAVSSVLPLGGLFAPPWN
ncbi:MAG: SulP family inorganic anion transporter [Brachymonas sp.]|nr:SulP family inorganic anion transporter [Brachymonas sp.]